MLITLAEFKSSRAAAIDDKIKTPKGVMKVTTRVDLNLAFLSPAKTDLKIEFYKGGVGDSVIDEILLAEKWAKFINSCIKSLK